MSLELSGSLLELQIFECISNELIEINGQFQAFSGLKITTGTQVDYVGSEFEVSSDGEKARVEWRTLVGTLKTLDVYLSRTIYSDMIALTTAINACKGGSSSSGVSTDAGNNATIGSDGLIFVPSGSATVNVSSPLTGDGSGGSPLGINLLLLDHDGLLNFESNEHIDHASVSVVAGGDDGLGVTNNDLTTSFGLFVDINGTTALGATADSADEILIYDVSTGALRKILISELPSALGTLNSANIFVGDGANSPQGVAMSGDVSIDNTGATTVIPASDTQAGKVELATDAETLAGTATDRALTPANLNSVAGNTVSPDSDDNAGAIGTSNRFAREDHKHPAQGVSADANNSIIIGADGLHYFSESDEVIENAGALSGAAPTGAQFGVDTDTGQLYYVNSGNWAAVPTASVDLNTTISDETGANGTGLTTPTTQPTPTPDIGDTHIEVYDDVTLYFTAAATNWTTPTVVEVPRDSANSDQTASVSSCTVTWYGTAGAITPTFAGGVLTLTKSAGSTVNGLTVDVGAADATYSTGVSAGSFKIAYNHAADGGAIELLKSPIVWQRTAAGAISTSNPLTYNSSINLDQRVDEFGSGVTGFVFQQVASRAPNGVLISLG